MEVHRSESELKGDDGEEMRIHPDYFEAQELQSTERKYLSKESTMVLLKVLDTLQPKEESILINRFFYGNTLDETGRLFGITGVRVWQIEKRALRKLRHPTRSRKLIPYLN